MSDNYDSEIPELPSLSEVGCNPNGPRNATGDANQNACDNNTHAFRGDTSDEKWRLLLEQQNRNFLAIVQAMQTPSSSADICLPNFDPEKPEIDSRAWLTTADMCVIDQNRKGPSLMIALSRALKGEASTWLSSVSYPGMTWGAFKELFTARYDCPETTASFLVNLNNKKPKENECLAAYAATLMTSIMTRWSGLTTEQIAIATVLAHVAKIDPRVQRLSFTTDIKTRSELQRELKAVSFLKRSIQSSEEREGPDAKKTRPSGSFTALKCFNCGRLGHKSNYCRHGRDLRSQEDKVGSKTPINASNQSAGKSDRITCFNCYEQGHYASNCPKRMASNGSSTAVSSTKEKRVDVCVLKAPAGILRHFVSRHMLSDVSTLPSVQLGDYLLQFELEEPKESVLEIARRELRETPDVVKPAVEELRSLLEADKDLRVPLDNDAWLVRFLRPCKFYPESAYDLIKRYYAFKVKHHKHYDGLKPSQEQNVFNHNVLRVLPNRDQYGRRVLVLELGKNWNHNKCSLDEVFKGCVLFLEAAMLEPESQICGAVVIFDMDGLSLQQAWQFTPQFAKRIVDWLQESIPLRIKGFYIINQPYIFNMVFQLFKPLLKEKLRSRIVFMGNDREVLYKYITPKCLPEGYGGTLSIPNVSGPQWLELLLTCDKEFIAINSYGYKKK